MEFKPTSLDLPVSTKIQHRLRSLNLRSFSNDNIAAALEPGDLEALVDEVAAKMEGVMTSLVIDTENDHNAKDTARRYAKMLLLETFNGRYVAEPDVTEFPNERQVDELYVVGPINVRSTCAHHHQAITGACWVGVLPKEKLIGLSKFHRTVNHLASRPQIQEELTEQIADALEALTQPQGLAVLVIGNHLCCGHRGVKDQGSRMVSTVLRGEMRIDKSLKAEFMSMVELTKVPT